MQRRKRRRISTLARRKYLGKGGKEARITSHANTPPLACLPAPTHHPLHPRFSPQPARKAAPAQPSSQPLPDLPASAAQPGGPGQTRPRRPGAAARPRSLRGTCAGLRAARAGGGHDSGASPCSSVLSTLVLLTHPRGTEISRKQPGAQ